MNLIDTVGIEIECNDISLNTAKSMRPAGWSVIADGSCRSHRYNVNGLEIINAPRSILEGHIATEYGAEFVSPPYTLDGEGMHHLMSSVSNLLSLLANNGETVSDLTSVHIHVNSGQPPLYVAKNMFRLWRALEAPFYRLSVAEHPIHRGVLHNSYMYCRPLSAPQIVKDEGGSYYLAYDMEKILSNAKTTEEVIMAFCRADYQPNKWTPHRYYGLNIGNWHTKGSTEFRTFNQTLQTSVIRAWVELCVAFVRTAYMDRLISVFPQFPLGAACPIGGEEFTFDQITRLIPISLISQESWVTLERLWNEAGWQPGAEPQVNHLVVKQDRRVPMSGIRTALRPLKVGEEAVTAIWYKFNYDNH